MVVTKKTSLQLKDQLLVKHFYLPSLYNALFLTSACEIQRNVLSGFISTDVIAMLVIVKGILHQSVMVLPPFDAETPTITRPVSS